MSINFFEPLDFTTYMGPEGKQWSESSSPWGYLFAECTKAVMLMRKNRLDEGKALLDKVLIDLDTIEEPLLRRVLDRFYQGAVGYYAYLIDDYEWAHAAMQAGCQAVADAVEQERFLIPFAHHCQELLTHRARIDRNRRRWKDMFSHIELGKAMNESKAPLCTLSDGTEVTYKTLGEVFSEIESLSLSQQKGIDGLLNAEQRRQSYATFTRKFMDPPGFIIHAA